jgi:hypothetical protein
LIADFAAADFFLADAADLDAVGAQRHSILSSA